MSRRILVLSASVGAGHLRAAEAVTAALGEVDPDATVKNVDVLELTNAAFRRVYSRTYFDLVNKAPQILGFMYELLDRPPSAQRKADRLRLMVERLNLRRFSKLLRAEGWDVIVNTHFLPAEIIAALRREGRADHAPVHRDHRFRDASPLGQSALRPLLHGNRRRGSLLAALGSARRDDQRDRHPRPSGLQPAEDERRVPARLGLGTAGR